MGRRIPKSRCAHRSFAARRKLSIEALEPRLFLAGDTYLINFQPTGVAVPFRYLVDTGAVFGARSGGLSYGWSSDHNLLARDRDTNADQRLDTLIHFHQNQQWEFALPNGNYAVSVSIGDPQFGSLHTINVESVNYWDGAELDPNEFLLATHEVLVSDGRLSINQGTAGEMATRINFVHIVGLPSGANTAPQTPTISEPAVDGQVVNAADVHMEATGFQDADGNAHKSTDWEIWTTGPGAQVVWQTLGIGGIEKGHTHLGDGVFINAAAGKGLSPNTNYELHVRFRDDAGSVSEYAVRSFITGPPATIFPLELQDIGASPAPRWINSANANIDLPSSIPKQSELRLESADGQLLLSISGHGASGNLLINPPAIAGHADLRVVVLAGSAGLNLVQTKLIFDDDHGQSHDVFLPAIALAPNERLDLWVSSSGATYYGTAAQTTPVFTSLARQVELPYVATQPGYVVEEVVGGLKLPTNIAFVPNPGPNPDDPFFYVTELYGTIKVVTRNLTVSNYATGLLNFNPTGAFPGSGEQGLTGIVVDPLSGDVFATRVTATNPANPNGDHHPQVLRFTSNDGGKTSAGPPTVILNMVGETQGQSHQISNISFGPDGFLYVHMGDGFDTSTGQNLNSFRGKVLRINRDGSPATDNPFYNAGNGITATDYVFAYGLRNPFGGAWQASDGNHYEVENGPSIDRLARIDRGVNYLYTGSDASMRNFALYNWVPSHAPVNITFVQPATFAGSQLPAADQDHAFVSESGPTLGIGPQSLGKRIVEFAFNADGSARVSGPTTLVNYVGDGAGSVVALAAGPDGLYFSSLYNDAAKNNSPAGLALAISPGAKIYRVRYVNPLAGDYNIDGTVDQADYSVWQKNFGSNLYLAADGNQNGIVDTADYAVWRDNVGAHFHVGAGAIAANDALEPPTLEPAAVEADAADRREAAANASWIPLAARDETSRLTRAFAAACGQASAAHRDRALVTLLDALEPRTVPRGPARQDMPAERTSDDRAEACSVSEMPALARERVFGMWRRSL